MRRAHYMDRKLQSIRLILHIYSISAEQYRLIIWLWASFFYFTFYFFSFLFSFQFIMLLIFWRWIVLFLTFRVLFLIKCSRDNFGSILADFDTRNAINWIQLIRFVFEWAPFCPMSYMLGILCNFQVDENIFMFPSCKSQLFCAGGWIFNITCLLVHLLCKALLY